MYDNKVIEQVINAILQVIIPDKIILFGSRARGEATADSDYDILVIKSGIENELRIEQSIYRKLFNVNASVDIIVKTPESIERSKDKIGSFIKYALAEGQVIYG